MSVPSEGPGLRTQQGTPYRVFRSAVERVVRMAGIAGMTFHNLRHTCARRLVLAGVDLPTVQELMGHKDGTMTLLEYFGIKVLRIFQAMSARTGIGYKHLLLCPWAASSTGRATDS